ncbi:DUF2336 domain-containing protein [Bradyrhizobium tropiciagri]|uniref:DUF2336 domain-containing protein n=1 Tax=Bradyrhizobium tropiciagri TaxID=312253 RepID=UPI001BA65BD3|nr:DUF2336 domain-containing protein [Bradyrhizobium tropiciagri]MBR0869321.1 DUF2336 domain-containing protein [Bradyrhizobium tropiciagri]
MAQQPAQSIIAELEDAVRDGTSAKRVQTLRRVTDLFLNDGDRLNDEQVKVFDDVLCLLVARVETRARAELSKRLAPLDYAPFEVIQYLAWDDDISVAGEVLTQSSRLSTEALREIASTKGQDHLLAISAREGLPESVTDVIIERGEDRVIRRLAKNASAQFSDDGYSSIVARAEGDDELVEILGLRIDLPARLLHDLLLRAKAAVRARLLAIAPPAVRDEIRQVLDYVAEREAVTPRRNYGIAEELVKLMKQLNELDDAAVYKFAEAGKFDEVTVALAVLNDVPIVLIEKLMLGMRSDLMLIPCRSARLNWPTVETILRKRPLPRPLDDATLELAQRDYRRLSLETAQRTVRFWQLHNRIEKQPAAVG